MKTTTPRIACLLLCNSLLPAVVGAQAQPSAYDRTWARFTEWYVDDGNDLVQSVRFVGRFQYEYAWAKDAPVSHDEWNVRRMRAGLRVEMFRSLTVHAEMDLNPQERDPTYVRLTDAYVEWRAMPNLALTVGKQGVDFTVDGSTSSRELITVDRSNLANNLWFPEEYMPGVNVSGSSSLWSYQLGVYSSGEGNREFGELDGSGFVLGVLGYDASDALGTDQALLRLNYVYQDADPLNTFTRPFEQIATFNTVIADPRWGLRTDLTSGWGYLGQSDVWGATLMPFFNPTPKLQVVARYTHLDSADPNGVRLARYENQVTGGRGNRYEELYLGGSYYFYGHRLKLQGGVQLADMDDEAADGGSYSGKAATLGVRVGW